MREFKKLEDVKDFKIDKERRFFSAQHEEIACGATTDIYFIKTLEILEHLGLAEKKVTAEVFPRRGGVLAGLDEVLNLLKDKDLEIWGLPEGETFESKETVLRIRGPYKELAVFETPLLGILASSCGWATAARECREAAGDKIFICFGARHVHPAVASVMERAAVIGGASGASCILAAKLLNLNPTGTVPHAAFLIAGDTLTISRAYDEVMPPDSPRIILVDTFKDEVEETLRVADLLKDKLDGIRLDTPSERGGVTPDLVKEVRALLNLKGYGHVKIFVSGGLTPEKIRVLSEAGADAFGVGSYISSASPIDMTMDVKEVDDKPVAKRGRLPGIIENHKLKRFK
ncbi:Nicotinate phosphoribosyltransferase pncB1 [Koleobacter methoxysyntrophicus]|jgi:nicotinate phosphoribosyltransferase|uniref:nicotinate phosphoribosyltransferase n=1 Tax=Koleobacter methoxysyntrophicus TaxID=2751313 RepID=A0A8A0RMB5_9FIRM|nr:nicotinate phosphoribosyltransferase [Koleobacter methoxysyntrophicus]MDK2901949.1 nicotinate phosphoribosyltransferase [Thermosediminibacterales bacterium]NPV43229.1 nicotinate phosphoribosyltransferase [Bacillota bacterium]QSQ09555.1 Nicotinate phosphoribosyltransferase pncB1 [Koleobacter methoxysyntrophicus]